jgi:hypothetical protein
MVKHFRIQNAEIQYACRKDNATATSGPEEKTTGVELQQMPFLPRS